MIFSHWFFLQKTNLRILLYYYETSGRLYFVRFWTKLKTSKRHFKIIWPLEARAEILKFFCWFFGWNDDSKSPFEINWPLTLSLIMRLPSAGRIQLPKNQTRKKNEVLIYSYGFDIFKKCRQEVLDEFSCIHF